MSYRIFVLHAINFRIFAWKVFSFFKREACAKSFKTKHFFEVTLLKAPLIAQHNSLLILWLSFDSLAQSHCMTVPLNQLLNSDWGLLNNKGQYLD